MTNQYNHDWTEKEINFIRDNCKTMPYKEIIKNLDNRTIFSTYAKVSRLGIMSGRKGFQKGSKMWKLRNKNRIQLKNSGSFTKESRKNLIIPKKDTSIEVKIQNFLKQLGIEFFTHQYMKEIEHGYQCDILIPLMNMVIECDGNYWHKYPIGNNLDHIRTKELLGKGFKVLRLWEHEIKKMDVDEFKERLNAIK